MIRSSSSSFVDDSTECAICLAPFTDDTPTITLKTCGHKWHTTCLRQQLKTALPNHSQRLVFTGCRCAKCGTFCDDNDELSEVFTTRRTDVLRERVDQLIRLQLRVDYPPASASPATGGTLDKTAMAREALLMDHGRRTYAFYLCAGCESPYFGGTIECADDGIDGERPSEDRYCPDCRPNDGIVCRQLREHQGLQIFKCRYCCQPSDFVCYGTVHFCNNCHDRNSERVRQQRGISSANRPALSSIPCPGASCPFPKPNGASFHQNGESAKCEQVYFCAGCESSSVSTLMIPPGGPNWIQNPSGEMGNTQFWTPQQRGSAWKVETADDDGTVNFVSSFYPCIMTQSVPLFRYVASPDTVTIEVSASFKGRTDCPSLFRMVATRSNAHGRTLEQRDTGVMSAPADAWERTSLILSPMAGTHTIAITIIGKDDRCWAGNFGSKVKNCSVRVLGENLQGNLLPLAPLLLGEDLQA